MRKKKTFEIAKKEISEKYSYLKLLEFNGNDKKALFLDKDYGEFEGNYRSILRGQKNHIKRSRVNREIKKKQTNLKRYGVENPFQSEEVKEKIKQTNLKKYGSINPQKNKNIREKTKKTNLKKYGVEYLAQNKNIYNKIKQTNLERYGVENTFQSEEIKKKIKQTNLKKYGVENVSKNNEIKEKKKKEFNKNYDADHYFFTKDFNNRKIKTWLKKYGVDHVFKSETIKEKIKKVNLERYDVLYPQQNKNIREKTIKTNLKKYGVEYPAQNKEIYNKIKQTNLKKYGNTHTLSNKNIKNKSLNARLKNGSCYNIDGHTLKDYYKSSKLFNIRCYATIQQNYMKYGHKALKVDFYNKLYGKSKISNLWLSKIEKELGYELIREYHIPTTLYRADGYDPKTNTIYEFNGDFWHGNLEKYSETDLHPIKYKTFKELYNDTIKKENKIKSLGYNVISIWENDFKINI